MNLHISNSSVDQMCVFPQNERMFVVAYTFTLYPMKSHDGNQSFVA